MTSTGSGSATATGTSPTHKSGLVLIKSDAFAAWTGVLSSLSLCVVIIFSIIVIVVIAKHCIVVSCCCSCCSCCPWYAVLGGHLGHVLSGEIKNGWL